MPAGVVSKTVSVRCVCGVTHVLPRQEIEPGLSCEVWRCSDCRRHFVIVGESNGNGTRPRFEPFYVEPVPRYARVRQTRPREMAVAAAEPPPPPAVWFDCRCGKRLECHSFMYGRAARCPQCAASMLAVVRYDNRSQTHVIVPEYLPKSR